MTTTEQKSISIVKKATVIHPEDKELFEELLRTRRFHDYDLILPDESKLTIPLFRKLIDTKAKYSDLFEVFSDVTEDWKPEERELGPTIHIYNSRLYPGEEIDLAEFHGHDKKVERIEPAYGAVIVLAGHHDKSTKKLRPSLEAILLHAEPEYLEVIIENDKSKITRLPFIGMKPDIAHVVINPLRYTPALITVLAQSGDVKDIYRL